MSVVSVFSAVLGLTLCVGGGLWGWDNFYEGRKLFGAALVGGSWLAGALGMAIWWWALL